MRASVEVSAPGKLVLFGEYAVLFGAPAVVAAIDRRAVVNLRESSVEGWEVTAPGLAPRPSAFEFGPGDSVCWDDEDLGRRHFALVKSLVEGMASAGSLDLEALSPFSATLDTRAFFEVGDGGRSKLGLGSSAALTTALATALAAWADGGANTKTEGRLQDLVDLHRGVQGGAGSGIDVAASLLGGVIRYQLSGDGSVEEVAPLDLPQNLRMVFVWTGRAASTGNFLGRLRTRREERPREVNPVLDKLGAVSSNGVAALSRNDAEGFLDEVDAFWQMLDQLGKVIGMPILSEEHLSLRRLAVDCGVRYKPSGAGGGDFGIAFTTDRAAGSAMADRASAEGFQILDLQIDPLGLTDSGS